MNLWTVFVTGLTTGGLSCLAVQGGLLAGYLATRKETSEEHEERGLHWREVLAPTSLFLVAKIVSYTVIGAILGAIGSAFQISLWLRVVLQLLVGLFMVASAMRLFNVHPVFQKFEIRPPARLRRILRNSAKGESWFTPILLGIFTILIPCGTTQAMEVLAVGTGSVFRGALTLFVFTLATVPLFFIIGVLARSGAKAWQGTLAKVTAAVVLFVGIYAFSGGLALAGFPYTLQAGWQSYLSLYKSDASAGDEATARIPNGDVQEITITVASNGYSPRSIDLAKNVPVRLTLKTSNTRGCSRAFVIPKYKIETLLPETGEEVVEFTPTEAGTVAFSCSMGMYTGKFNVR